MSATRIMGMIKDFLEGNVKADTFSFDLPDALIEFGSAMKRANPALYELLNEELPDICSYYEPNTDERSERPEYLDENEFRGKVQQIYSDAIELI